jgi:hypothetical protein
MTTSRWSVLPHDYFPLPPQGHLWDCTASYLPASTEIDYFKHLNMSTVWKGTAGASTVGPASGYKLELSHLFVVLFLFVYRLSANISNPDDVIILIIFNSSLICFMTFGIKIYRKIPKILTFVLPCVCDIKSCKPKIEVPRARYRIGGRSQLLPFDSTI